MNPEPPVFPDASFRFGQPSEFENVHAANEDTLI
jgi:hypothetical protein